MGIVEQIARGRISRGKDKEFSVDYRVVAGGAFFFSGGKGRMT